MRTISSCATRVAVLALLVGMGVAPPFGADAARLGGITTTKLMARQFTGTPTHPFIIMADNFTTASAVQDRTPESVGVKLWSEISGHWAVRNGYLDPPMSPNALVLYPAEADVETTMVVSITGAYDFGPVVRATATGTSFLFGHVSSAGQAVIAQTIGNTTTVLASATVPALTGTFTVGLRAFASGLTLLRDGVALLNYVLPNPGLFTGTSTGVWVSSSGNERLDDIRVIRVT